MKTEVTRSKVQSVITSKKHIRLVGTCLIIGLFALSGCSRSAWMKSDGREVAPKEQLACAEEIGGDKANQVLDHDELQPKIEDCMLAKGYHRRPWWLLNDLHWDARAMP